MLLMVGAGGAVGSMMRYLLTRWLPTSFPWATLTANVLGCLLIGVLYGWFDRNGAISPLWRVFLTVGVCGGFTTFSTFMNDAYKMADATEWMQMGMYAALSLLVGFAAVWLGHRIMY